VSGSRSLADRVLAAIAAQDRDRAIAYLDDRIYGPERPLVVDRTPMTIAVPSRVAFVDLEPAANWAHRACFVVLPEVEGDEAQIVPAQLPPYRGASVEHFSLLWRGAAAPEWAVAVTRIAD
jgi:hypothetical protein